MFFFFFFYCLGSVVDALASSNTFTAAPSPPTTTTSTTIKLSSRSLVSHMLSLQGTLVQKNKSSMIGIIKKRDGVPEGRVFLFFLYICSL